MLCWCEWIRHSSAAGNLEDLSVTAGLRIVHQLKLSSKQRPVGSVLWAVSSDQRPVTTDKVLEEHKLCSSSRGAIVSDFISTRWTRKVGVSNSG